MSLNYPENCCVSQPGRACKPIFPRAQSKANNWDISRRPVDPDHGVTRAKPCPETWLHCSSLTSACSRDWGQPHIQPAGLRAFLVHARPGHGHPKQLDQVCTTLGKESAARNGSTKASCQKMACLRMV